MVPLWLKLQSGKHKPSVTIIPLPQRWMVVFLKMANQDSLPVYHWSLHDQLIYELTTVHVPMKEAVIWVPTGSNLGSCVFCTPLDRYIGRHIDRLSTDVSVNISVECRSICRSTYRPICRSTYRTTYIDRLSADISVDVSADTLADTRPIHSRYVDHWLSAEYWSTVGGISVINLDCQWQMYTRL